MGWRFPSMHGTRSVVQDMWCWSQRHSRLGGIETRRLEAHTCGYHNSNCSNERELFGLIVIIDAAIRRRVKITKHSDNTTTYPCDLIYRNLMTTVQ